MMSSVLLPCPNARSRKNITSRVKISAARPFGLSFRDCSGECRNLGHKILRPLYNEILGEIPKVVRRVDGASSLMDLWFMLVGYK